jgi:Putative phage tail protein
MATLILQTIGSALAGPIGAALGAIAGTVIDRAIIGGPNIQREGPRLTDLTVQNSSYGEALPLTYGTVRIAGNIIWSSGLIERRSEQTQGGKSGSVTTTSYSYFASFAVALAGHEIGNIKRIWGDGKLLRTRDGTLLPGGQMRLYHGSEDQMPDALIEAAVGLDYAPAHRGAAYVVFEELPLADFANRIPNLTFEIEAVAGQATTDLSAILQDVLTRCDVRQRTVVSNLATLPGFVVAREASGRSVVETLAPILPVALSDNDGAIFINPIAHGSASHVFDALRLGAQSSATNSDQKADERQLAPAAALPGELQLRYSDPLRDYQINMQRTRRFAPRTNVRQTVDIPAVLSADRAKQMAEQMLARLWRERQKRQIRLPLSHINVRPGDSISFSDQPLGIWLVQSIALEDGGLTLGLLPLSSTDLQSSAVADGGGLAGQNPAPHGSSQGYLLDLPPIEALLPTAPRLYAVAAGSSSGWRRASIWLSSNLGQSYAQAATINRATVIGATTVSPGAAAPGIWDEANHIEVELLGGDMQLLSRPAAAILAGSNLAMIGTELIHFRDAIAVTAQRYRLSGLLRGVRGTETAIADHSAGEPFVLLDPLPDIFTIAPLAAVGQPVSGKFLSPGQGLGDVPAQSILLRGHCLRPLSPVHGQHKQLPNGDRTFSWIRRSRSGFEWLDGIDAPLAEANELYRLTIKVGSSVRRSLDVVEPHWTYTAAQQLTDGSGSGFGQLEIAQLSAAIGTGSALNLNF